LWIACADASTFISSLFVSFTAFSQTTTSQAGAWNSGATWGGSVPTSGTNVVIAHDVTCNSEQTAGTMTVNSGITLTVNTAGKLTANGEVTNNGTIVVTGGENASGSLIATDASSFTYTYKLYIPATEWKLVGIPVTNLTVDDVDNDLALSRNRCWKATISSPEYHMSETRASARTP
jgi:hypothetical protein